MVKQDFRMLPFGRMAFALALLSLHGAALALSDGGPKLPSLPDDTCERIRKAASERFDMEKALIDKMADYAGQVAQNEKSCLDKYTNVSISAKVGFPSASSLLAGLADSFAKQACQALDQAAAKASSMTGANAVLPGGMGYVNVGTFYNAGQGGVSASTQAVDTGYAAGTAAGNASGSTVFGRIMNLFK